MADHARVERAVTLERLRLARAMIDLARRGSNVSPVLAEKFRTLQDSLHEVEKLLQTEGEK